MIIADVGKITPQIEDAISPLREHPSNFYLFGSRLFGHAHEDSDWDFVTEFNPEDPFGENFRRYLISRGCIVEKWIDSGYLDESGSRPENNTKLLIEYNHPSCHSVQITFVEDIAVWRSIVLTMQMTPLLIEYHRLLSTEERKKYWDTMKQAHHNLTKE